MPSARDEGWDCAILAAGYNADFLDAEAIQSASLGTHQIVVIPPTDRMPVDTLRRLQAWSEKGGKVIAVGHLPGMTPEGKPLPEPARGITLVADCAALGEALHAAAAPDLQLGGPASSQGAEQIGFIRRHLAFADIYFVVNTGNLPVREAALVFVNGQQAGALWHPPYRLEVRKLLKTGTNRIEIHVFNTALNAWSALPPHDYQPLIARYGDRFQMQNLDQVKPVSSGLSGTIKLVRQGGL